MRKSHAQQSGPQRRRSLFGSLAGLALALLFGTTLGVFAADETAIWRALASKGHVALLRHAIAPGAGDPSDFVLGDCAAQRNLSGEGRKQAQRIGARFKKHGLETAQVSSSQWCRSLETARLLGLGSVTELPVLNSFFQRPERRNHQTKGLESWLANQDLAGPLVLVTHQVNITALTGVFPASGELVVIRRSENGNISVIGSLRTE